MNDNGYASRKLWFGVFTANLVLCAGVLSGWLPVMATQLSVVVGGLISVYALYTGGNVASKWVGGKEDPPTTPPTPVEKEPDAPSK